MTNQFSKKVSDILLQSKEEARRTDYAAVMPEHLLLGLMQDETGPVNVLLRNENINRQAVQKELEERLSQEQSANNAKGDAFDRMAATDNEVMLTEKATNILRLAVLKLSKRPQIYSYPLKNATEQGIIFEKARFYLYSINVNFSPN